MRIVGGEKRGRKLESPAGEGTRPTSDKTRESVFNILAHAKWLEAPLPEDACVLDIFAGTGALGLEALSRGAEHAVFVEQNRAAAALCRRNIEMLGYDGAAQILVQAAEKLMPRPADIAPRTLVFLDPPYGKGMGVKALTRLTEGGWLAPGAICIFEMAKKQREEIPQGFEIVDERPFGIALVRFLRFRG